MLDRSEMNPWLDAPRRLETMRPERPGILPDGDTPPTADEDTFRGHVRELRHRYQKGLVAWLRGQDPGRGLDEMRAVIDALEALSGESALGRLWWASAGLLEAVHEGGLEADVSVRYLLSGVDRHLKRLADEGLGALAGPPPDFLETLVDVVARADSNTPRVAAVRESARATRTPEPTVAPAWSEGLCELTESLGRSHKRAGESVGALREQLAEFEHVLRELETRVRRVELESKPTPRPAHGGSAGGAFGVAAARALDRLERTHALSRSLTTGLEEAGRLRRRLAESVQTLAALIRDQMGANASLGQALRRLESPEGRVVEEALLVDIGAETFGMPLHAVEAVVRAPADLKPPPGSEEHAYYEHASGRYPVAELAELTGGSAPPTRSSRVSLALLHVEGRRGALRVDAVTGPQTLTVEPLAPPLGATRWVRGAAVLGDARVVLVLDVPALLEGEVREKGESTFWGF
ncbi:MAG: hypothetical protein GWN84_23385 [Gammaproteobacteria bacterium]|nr:hypothetical protein [Gammaproteobacteria bacterium]NIR85545.1 hypothetical protein [Gammaproteobacteria bacterium]NIR89804.1 hypothetical protein [Gammaproteobacteria bacterium]NIU06680.1 hypothetical protein [Gammaproteobacteria bacterium]NIV75071.1 hypothetical protein [Gammaproteobacteria bacterium]